jgi:hypothetical protein
MRRRGGGFGRRGVNLLSMAEAKKQPGETISGLLLHLEV